MDPDTPGRYLGRIPTPWSLLCRAHDGNAAGMRAAREELVGRYQGAVYAYLLGALRDPEAAQELFQEFCLRFLRGDFHKADREKGRFRQYVKTALCHLARRYQWQQRTRPYPLPEDWSASLTAPADGEPDSFGDSWRQGLLDRAWQALEEEERRTRTPYHTLLQLRADQPELSGSELAGRLSERLGRPVNEGQARQLLHRAREKFADYLYQDVAHSLEDPAPGQVEEELGALGLLSYCQSAVQRRRAP